MNTPTKVKCFKHIWSDWYINEKHRPILIRRCKVCKEPMYLKEFLARKKILKEKFDSVKISHIDLFNF